MNEFEIGDKVRIKNQWRAILNGVVGIVCRKMKSYYKPNDYIYIINFDKIKIDDKYSIDYHVVWSSELEYFDPEIVEKRKLARFEHILEDPYGEENWL